MARTRFLWLAAMAALALVGALGVVGASAAPRAEPHAGSVVQWNAIAVKTLTALPQPAGGAAPSSQISVGMVQGAVYDAVNAVTPKHRRPYLLTRRFGSTASDEAAGWAGGEPPLEKNVREVPPTNSFPTKRGGRTSPRKQDNPSPKPP